MSLAAVLLAAAAASAVQAGTAGCVRDDAAEPADKANMSVINGVEIRADTPGGVSCRSGDFGTRCTASGPGVVTIEAAGRRQGYRLAAGVEAAFIVSDGVIRCETNEQEG